MHIVECDDSNRQTWNEFVDRHHEATFYHRFEWQALNRTCFGHASAYLGAEQLFWHYILHRSRTIPALNVQNPRYTLAIEACRRLPLGVTQLVGPSIARSIP